MEKPTSEDLPNLEKAGWVSENKVLASMGIYIFKKEILKDALNMAGDDFGKDIVPEAVRTYHTSAYRFEDYWEDIGTIDAFFNANIALTKPNPEFTFYDVQNPIYTHPRFLPGSRLEEAEIYQSFISEGCVVGKSKIKDSILGMRSVVGNDVFLERVYLMGADFYDYDLERDIYSKIGIGDGSILKNVILDKNVSIGKNVVLDNTESIEEKDGEFYYIREGIIVIPKGTQIPDFTCT